MRRSQNVLCDSPRNSSDATSPGSKSGVPIKLDAAQLATSKALHKTLVDGGLEPNAAAAVVQFGAELVAPLATSRELSDVKDALTKELRDIMSFLWGALVLGILLTFRDQLAAFVPVKHIFDLLMKLSGK